MSSKRYIFGHKNPDPDSICAAIAYQKYKEAHGQTDYVAARCGNSNARIDAIMERFKADLPVFIGDVTPRAKDIMRSEIVSVKPNAPCLEALELMDEHNIRALPVVNDEGQVVGTISIFDMGDFFTPRQTDESSVRQLKSTLNNIVKCLDAKVLNLVEPDRLEDLYVKIGAMDIRSFISLYKQSDLMRPDNSIVVVGDRWDIQEKSLQNKTRLLVITGNMEVDEDIQRRAKKAGVSLIVSPKDSATTTLSIRVATNVEHLMNKDFVTFSENDKIDVIKRRVSDSNHPIYFVLDDEARLSGVFSKADLLQPVKREIVLVDHNEIGQAVNGADKVTILEIIDHHRLANTPTQQPVLFINRPVGSSCTIIADMFRKDGIKPDPQTAGIMMSGIISDTLNLRSPTATGLDSDILKWLALISGEDPSELTELLFSAGSVILNSSPMDIIKTDLKLYTEGDCEFSVSQIEVLGFENFRTKQEEILNSLIEYRNTNNLYMSALLVTNVNTQNSLLLISAPDDIVENITYAKMNKIKGFTLPGVVSRKKQLLPYLISLLEGSLSLSIV